MQRAYEYPAVARPDLDLRPGTVTQTHGTRAASAVPPEERQGAEERAPNKIDGLCRLAERTSTVDRVFAGLQARSHAVGIRSTLKRVAESSVISAHQKTENS
jgi:hypothetical protein